MHNATLAVQRLTDYALVIGWIHAITTEKRADQHLTSDEPPHTSASPLFSILFPFSPTGGGMSASHRMNGEFIDPLVDLS